DQKIVIAGTFNAYDGIPRQRVARLNTNGTLDPTFDPGGAITFGTLYQVELQQDGKVIIGGAFASYAGVPMQSIARLETSGAPDPTFGPVSGPLSNIWALAIDQAQRIVAAGYFNAYGGVGRNHIVRLNGGDADS